MGGNSEQIMETLQNIHLELCDIKTALTGGLDGKPGLISRVSTIEKDNRKKNQLISKIIFASIGSGGIFGIILKLIHWI